MRASMALIVWVYIERYRMRLAERPVRPLPRPQARPRGEPRPGTALLTSEVLSAGKAAVFILAISLLGWAIMFLLIYGLIALL